jgi:drug/metabolite transporter (DMT)-like permease
MLKKFIKRSHHPKMVVIVKELAYVSLALSILFAGVSPIFFKLAVVNIKKGPYLAMAKAFLMNRNAIVGLILYGASSVLWLVSLSYLEVSLMYPLLSLAYVITTLLAATYLRESVAAIRWVGVLLIVLGSILVGLD